MKYTLKLTKARMSQYSSLLLDWTLSPAGWRKREPWACGFYEIDGLGVRCAASRKPIGMTTKEEVMLDSATYSRAQHGHLALLLVLLGRVTLRESDIGFWEPDVIFTTINAARATKKINAGLPCAAEEGGTA